MKNLGVIGEESKDKATEMSASVSVVSEMSGTSKGRLSVSVDPEVLRMATLGEDEDADGERTKILCCGICCDARLACLIIDCIYFFFVVSALIMLTNNWNPLGQLNQETSFYEDDHYSTPEIGFDPSQILMAAAWQVATGIVMSAVGFVGGLKFQPYLVLAMAVWLCIDAVVFCVQLNFISAVCVGLYSYPHFALFNLLKKGKISRENYAEKERYCCCINDEDRDDDDDADDD